MSNIQIAFDGPDRATGLTYLYAWHRYLDGSPDGELWGRYHHRFERTPDGWRIAGARAHRRGEQGIPPRAMHPTGRR